ncbi:Hypothetical protein FKW44_016145 [Caligus rogercresseyi]|uniref:Uncharacterized protein n=1 Tax=Caligus rogercresseyi TaxID=217165 RepID=A0A7T8H1B0_CALRO|nr:Hypothetical protein FKW44_016145 [Caligus rogercresseyi]
MVDMLLMLPTDTTTESDLLRPSLLTDMLPTPLTATVMDTDTDMATATDTITASDLLRLSLPKDMTIRPRLRLRPCLRLCSSYGYYH